MTARTISVIGAGRIGSAVIEHVKHAPGLRLGRVLTRSGDADTGDIAELLAGGADLIVEAAGPAALARYGADCLAVADVWSVGAAALADPEILARMDRAALTAGTRLRLFSPWAYGTDTAPRDAVRSLRLRVVRSGLSPWRGPVRQAAELFPAEVSFAVAAALNGPGIDWTELEFVDPPEAGLHRIETECVTEAGLITASIRFSATGRHPTALSLIAALEQLKSRIT